MHDIQFSRRFFNEVSSLLTKHERVEEKGETFVIN